MLNPLNCKYCDKKFDKPRQRNGHHTTCIKNPNRTIFNGSNFGDIAAAGRKGAENRVIYEHALHNELVAQGAEVWDPRAVCDRVMIKDGKVYFVEFKFEGQELRPAQQKVKDLLPENYIVIFKKRS